jgi:DNA-binding SARP family transcriptional activator
MANDDTGALCCMHLYLLGSLSVTDANGSSCTPKAQKSRALIAMLALAPRGTRSRVWLRTKLWSDRGEEQAAASLRQALVDVRKSLGMVADRILLADNHTISLDLGQVRVDVFDLLGDVARAGELANALPMVSESDLLEGLDIGDPEFEEWLTLERQVWNRRFESALALGELDRNRRGPKRHATRLDYVQRH